MKTLRLHAINTFHGRSCRVYAKGDKRYYISRRQYKRFWAAVCGVHGCCCSTSLVDAAGNEYLAVSSNGLSNPDVYEIVLDN